MISVRFEAIGTSWQIDFAGSFSSNTQDGIVERVKSRIEKFDISYSRFRSDSFVTRVSQLSSRDTSCCVSVPFDAEPLFLLYQRLYDLTGGLFTPLIGQVLVDAGYDAEYSLKERRLRSLKALDEVFTYRHPVLEVKEPALLDFGAAGKGYIIDIVGELLESEGINSYCVDAGGDMRYRNLEGKPLRVGLENPGNTKQVVGVVPLENKSICASAGNRRKWGNFHHIFNPHLLSPVKSVLATWVIADTTLLADALSTCLFLVSNEVLRREYEFEYLVLYPDYSIEKSEGFNAELF